MRLKARVNKNFPLPATDAHYLLASCGVAMLLGYTAGDREGLMGDANRNASWAEFAGFLRHAAGFLRHVRRRSVALW